MSVPPALVPVPGGHAVVFSSQTELASIAWRFHHRRSASACCVAAFAAIAVGRYVASSAVRPLQEVARERKRFGTGDFTTRDVDVPGAGSLDELAAAYNAAAAQVKRALAERTQAEADMRRFVADAAHELRTPLTVVTGYVALLRDGIDAEAAPRVFERIDVASRRMRDLIAKMLTLARLDAPQPPEAGVVDLGSIVEGALDALPVLETAVELQVDVRTGIRVRCDPSEMRDALQNLFVNALKYAPGSTLVVRLRESDGAAKLVISDDGPGMSAADREHAFERFYRGTARGDVEGSGLGLAIVKRVIARAGGDVGLESGADAGSTFTIRLPLATV